MLQAKLVEYLCTADDEVFVLSKCKLSVMVM